MNIDFNEPQLSPDEQRECERQQKELKHKRFHDSGKCGEKLLVRVVVKKHAHLKRLYCPTHHIYLDMTGWEVGFYGGTYNRIRPPIQPEPETIL